MEGQSHPNAIVPVVAAIILNQQGQVLIARRKRHLGNGGKWEFPGGKLGAGEPPEICIQREIREEMGIAISVEKIFHAVNVKYPDFNILLLAYFCTIRGGEWDLQDHDEIRWVSVTELSSFDLSGADVELAKVLAAQAAPP